MFFDWIQFVPKKKKMLTRENSIKSKRFSLYKSRINFNDSYIDVKIRTKRIDHEVPETEARNYFR